MEFDDEDEHEDQEDQEIGIQVPRNYDPALVANSGRPKTIGKGGGNYRYRECQKNHAVGIGGHAVDGCCEFMPAGDEGSLDALRCAACNCHRNFHRKEAEGEAFPHHHLHHHQQQHFSPYYRGAHPAGFLHMTPPQLAHHQSQRPLSLQLPSTPREDQEDVSNPSSSGGGSGSKKRFRTKFTQEQKEKMLELAERLGWRIQKQEEAAVQQFCQETGVKRQVLKVWMHNNKHSYLGKNQPPPPPPLPPPTS